MTVMTDVRTYQFKALTDLWTGGADGKPDRLITAGLLGSIRWWFEVLVRGLGGSACDPTDTKCEDRNHCVVCELFGCTGWARKFRFEVLDENGNIKTNQIKGPDRNDRRQGDIFSFRFTPLRSIRGKEWALLGATLHLIVEYGAIGGKTVLKPSDETVREGKPQHKDYGVVEFVNPPKVNGALDAVREYISQDTWQKPDHDGFVWASLKNFWCVKGRYLARQNGNASSFNRVITRPEPKQQNGQGDSWIAGRRPDQRKNVEAESKKVFSFKEPKDATRTFGFVKPDLISFAEMKKRLREVWPNLQDGDFREGPAILNNLLQEDRP